MIQDYCRENKVAIHFTSHDQLNSICKQFGDYKESINFIEGMVSFTIINEGQNVLWNYRCTGILASQNSWYKDFTIITADEFFELVDEGKSILEIIARKD